MNTKLYLKRFKWNFLKSFGLIWLFLEPATNFIDYLKDKGNSVYFGIIIIALIISLVITRSKNNLKCSVSGGNSNIEIKSGDLFDQNSHIVVGVTDVFDTALGDVIKPTSIQGQFTQKFYNSDTERLDSDINRCIQAKGIEAIVDNAKTRGKNIRYPVGTTLSLGNSKKAYLSAYSFMSNSLKAESNSDRLWHSMNELWKEIRLTGQGDTVSIPVIGSDLARTGLTRLALIQMIVISFVSASNTEFVSKTLNIIIHESDLDKIDFIALEHFLESIDT